ncbi:hypothetical protein [Goodfellowiella coeruleoviolacea]|uniref:Uncharacterized protein n=1 Tax=Goodfellowiella coeruleoviolacea TaxID=334858 RepID=A0AAE3KNN0_9PSEU|nr:hypothetical protein [Goodfellowiella coeruleoviolacea]MCP2168848.1 hypothetical protein [Goodfellowiella coeruleoviolacea]
MAETWRPVRFSGISPLRSGTSLIDVTLDELGDVDLRNDASVTAIRFLPGKQHMSIFFDFRHDSIPVMITLEFCAVELDKIGYYLPTGVEPTYGNALLSSLLYWKNQDSGREGFTVDTTALEVEFYTEELRAQVWRAWQG